MNNAHMDHKLPAHISGVQRYERVATLEAVLNIRDRNTRARLKCRLAIIVLVAAPMLVMFAIR